MNQSSELMSTECDTLCTDSKEMPGCYSPYFSIADLFEVSSVQEGSWILQNKYSKEKFVMKRMSAYIEKAIAIAGRIDTKQKYLCRFQANFMGVVDEYVISNYIEGKDFFEYVKDKVSAKERISQMLILPLLLQLSLQVKKFHDENVYLLDIKLENTVFDEATGEIHFIDYDYCSDTVFPTRGTDGYIAPELMFSNVNLPESRVIDGKKVDIWSLGVFFYCCIFGSLPMDSYERSNLSSTLTRSEYYTKAYANIRFTFPVVISDFTHKDSIIKLVKSMLSDEQSDRPTIEDVFEELEKCNNCQTYKYCLSCREM